jgi:hypothetical protein
MRKFIALGVAAFALSLAAPVATASASPMPANVLAKAEVTPAQINPDTKSTPDTKSAANEFGNCYCGRTYYRVRYYRVRYVPVRYVYRTYSIRYYVY